MSFDLLTKDYTPKRKEITIAYSGGELTFTAVELSALEQKEIGVKQVNGGNWLTQLIVGSIRDQDGKKMTAEQASRLPQEYADEFLKAALEVNKQDAEEKK